MRTILGYKSKNSTEMRNEAKGNQSAAENGIPKIYILYIYVWHHFNGELFSGLSIHLIRFWRIRYPCITKK